MKICYTVPIDYLDEFGSQSNMHFLLAHIALKNEKYCDFYKKRREQGDYIIMDNSNFELGNPLSIKDVLKAADVVGAQEVVIPDHYGDTKATIQEANYFVKYLKENRLLNKYKLQGVPQGRTKEEWRECYEAFLYIPEIETIGLSYTATRVFKDWGSDNDETYIRPALLHWLKKTYGAGRKYYHCLGVANNPIEISLLARHDSFMRSIDSTVAFLHGMNGIKFDEKRGLLQDRLRDKLDFDVKNVSKENLDIIQHNVNCIKRWAL